MPARDPAYTRLPWARTGVVGWGAALLLGPLVGAIAVGAAWSFIEARAGGRAGGAAAAGPKAKAEGDAVREASECGASTRNSLEAQRPSSSTAQRKSFQIHAQASDE